MEPSTDAEGRPGSTLSIVICEDHQLYAEGLSRSIEAEDPGVEVVAVTSRVDECLGVVEEALPQIVLMDIALPEVDGIEGARRVRMVAPTTRVVMLTASDDPEDLFRALKAGAVHYILKEEDIGAIVETLHEVAQGRYMLPQFAAPKVGEVIEEQPGVSLTEQETLILEMLGSGESQKVIGRRLNLRDRTLRRRIRAICDKLHLASRIEAALYAVREASGREGP